MVKDEEIDKDDLYEEGRKMLILGLKVVKPDISDRDAENVIVNVGNYIQFKRLTHENNNH